ALPVHLWHLRRPRTPDDTTGTVRMVELTANEADGPLEPRPEQIRDVPQIDLLDDLVDLTPSRYVQEVHRDCATEYDTLCRERSVSCGRRCGRRPVRRGGERQGGLAWASLCAADRMRAGLRVIADP